MTENVWDKEWVFDYDQVAIEITPKPRAPRHNGELLRKTVKTASLEYPKGATIVLHAGTYDMGKAALQMPVNIRVRSVSVETVSRLNLTPTLDIESDIKDEDA